ncbi:MAG: hypothetical protein R2800_08620 [Flavipsychrobacter sp.]
MQRLVVIILILFCGLGTICSPTGNFSCANYVPEMYARCLAEDDEITAADFFFEHLLSLETIIEFIENDVDDKDDELPNYPYHLPQPPAQTVVTVHHPLQLTLGVYYDVAEENIYDLYRNPMKLGSFSNDVFRPPAV